MFHLENGSISSLRGKNTSMFRTSVSGTRVVDSISYSVPSIDRNEKHLYITAYEIERISNDIAGVKHLISAEVKCRWDSIMESLFGTGFILTGSHPEIKSESITWSEDVSAIRHSAGTSPHMVNRITVFPNYNYFEHDILGVQPPKRCFKCRGCKECSFRGHKLSQQEQYEQKLSTILSSSHSLHHIHAEDPSIPKDQKK